MWRAIYESTNFSFEAYGKTEMEAKETLILGLNIHAKQYICEPDWFFPGDIYAYPIETLVPYRDRSVLLDIRKSVDLLDKVIDEWVVHANDELDDLRVRGAFLSIKKQLGVK